MNKQNNDIKIELSPEVAQGTYANLAIIAHSSSEFVMDFVSLLPGVPAANVKSRVIMTPENAKRLAMLLQENIAQYEKQVGEISLYTPHEEVISFEKGEA
ncbi:MAG: DUF3467 domain-containing protein [Tannerellaceae bacterium]|nr:DUF3467 domain-containing protein [Porphyromonadaceae bacterium]